MLANKDYEKKIQNILRFLTVVTVGRRYKLSPVLLTQTLIVDKSATQI